MAGKFLDDIIGFSKLEGMNTQSSRYDLPENKAAWMENLQPIGPNNLLCVPAPAAPIQNIAGENITEQFYAYLNGIDYIICFCASGAGYAIQVSNGNQTTIAPAGTFSGFGDATTWDLSILLIADQVVGYSAWNGTVFVKQGGVSPNIEVTDGGSGYTSGAAASITGGSGSGAAADVIIVGGVVTGLTLINAGTGYKAGDVLTVTISPFSGLGSGATASAHVWPFLGVTASTIAIFSGRVWLGSTNVITYTGTGASYGGIGYDDFLSGDAAGSFTITDTDLVHTITALRNLNNYLFIIGDASVKQIGNISLNSAATATNFTVTTLSSDQGTTFRNTVVSYNRLVLFANTVGVYAVFGSSVEKISDEMDGIFRLINFGNSMSAAINDVNNIHCFLLLVKYQDPVVGARSLILAFMNKKWFVISQGDSLAYIVTASINGVTETFSTSGSDITQILQDPTTAVNIKLQTSLSSHGKPYIGKRTGRYAVVQFTGASSSLTLLIESERSPSQSINYSASPEIQFVNNSFQDINFVNNSNMAINFTSTYAGFLYQTGNTQGTAGVYLGMTLTGSVQNYTLNNMMLEYSDAAPFGSAQVNYGQTL